MKSIKNVFIALLILIKIPVFVFLSICILTYVFHGKPIFFRQERAGKNGKPFQILKFRTMTNDTDDTGTLLPSYERVTKFGKFLRKTSLDELPQLLNILKGEITLVGPRPLHMEYNQYYNDQQKKRLLVKPGITGYAQVNGRNNLTWEEKFKLDVYYVENKSLLLDLKILLMTLIKVIRSDDINPNDKIETPRFRGVEGE